MKMMITTLILAIQITAAAQNSNTFVPTITERENQVSSEDPNLQPEKNPDGSQRTEGSVFVPAIDPNCSPCREKYLKAGKKNLGDRNLSHRARGQFISGSSGSSGNKSNSGANIEK
jgi:hypothetical protein